MRFVVPLYLEIWNNLPLKAITQLLRPPILGQPNDRLALCRRRLSEGTSAALVQVGFQPVTNPLLERARSAYSFPINASYI